MVLNRPKKLNSLNQSMVDKITLKLKEWMNSSEVHSVYLKGAGGKALSAGGDVAAIAVLIAERGGPGSEVATAFFQDEYIMNHLIATYPKPYIALMHGVTMGGGVGVSIHAPFRIATEKTLFAMPETDIGFFPDVGATYFLSRLDGEIGTYLALSSARLRGYETVSAGLATHYITTDKLPEFEKRLKKLAKNGESKDSFDQVNKLLEEFSSGPPQGYRYSLSGERRKLIDRAFGKSNAVDIIAELEKEGSEFSLTTVKTIRQRSPLSVQVTLRALRRGLKDGIIDALNNEFRLAERFMYHQDFVEGVTSKLVLKPPRVPVWKHSSVEEVSESEVKEMLSPKPDSKFQDIDFIDKSLNFHQYPHSYGLPSEFNINQYVNGRSQKPTQEQVISYFEAVTQHKKGVVKHITEILNRAIN